MMGPSYTVTTATVTLKIHDNIHTATAQGLGPANALDICLRQCLSSRSTSTTPKALPPRSAC